MSHISQIIPPDVAPVFITHQLARRHSRAADYLQETVALRDLATQMIDDPQRVLPRLVDIAIEMCGAVSGGISLYEPEPAPGVFRWHHLRGDLARFTGVTTPRNFSPCGITLDHRSPILVQRPERVYTWLQEAQVSLPECLLVPLYLGGDEPLGTLWIVSADEGHFDQAHSETMAELAAFTGIALKMASNEQRLRLALDRQEMLAREMDHRVKNLFAVVDGIVRMSARSGGTAKDVSENISARLRALTAAHDLVRNAPDPAKPETELRELLRNLIDPHESSAITLGGPSVRLGAQSMSNLALVFHELATNAVKYGALAAETGRLSVNWTVPNGQIEICWRETGGVQITRAPDTLGFGTLLAERTIGAMGGKIVHDWQPAGLVIRISIPLDRVSR